MSRVGRKPIIVPEGVTVTVTEGNEITVTGPKGTLSNKFNQGVEIKQTNNEISFERSNDLPFSRAIHGTTRSLFANMVTGVTEGFSKKLELVGVGYRVQANGQGLTLALGFSHPVEIAPVEGITFTLEGNTKITISGIEKQLVGQVAADIRVNRPPEPYKGKGVKYSDEVIRRKEGKKG